MLAEGFLIKCVSAYETDSVIFISWYENYENYENRQLQKGCNILICTPKR